MSAQAQDYNDNNNGEPIFWDQDAATPPVDLENGTFSYTPDGSSPGQYYINNINYDIAFSASTVGTEAQTIYFDGTVSPAQGYVVGGIYFNQGSITLENDSTNPSAALFIGTDGITMSAGTGAASISIPTLYLVPAESWDNNSSAELTVDAASEAGYSSTDLTFAGTGTGAVNITGALSAGIGIDQESATSTLYLANVSNPGITSININYGTVVATDMGPEPTYNYKNVGSLGGNSVPIDIEHGGILTILSVVGQTPTFNRSVNITDGGTINFGGDVILGWSSDQVTADTLTFGTGDELDASTGSQNIQTLDLVGSGGALSNGYRLIVGINGQGYGFLSGISTINVDAGYIFDMGNVGSAGSQTIDNVVNIASGAAIESRDNGTVYFGANTSLPVGGTVYLGGDDDANGNLNFTGPIDLTSNLTVGLVGSNVGVYFSGVISGPGGLVVTGSTDVGYLAEGLFLTGKDTYSGATVLSETDYLDSADFPNGAQTVTASQPYLYIAGDESGVGNEFDVQFGNLVVDPAGKMPTTAVVTLEATRTQGDYAAFTIGDGNGAANATVAGIQTDGVNNGSDVIQGGNSSVSSLTLDPAAGQVFEYDGVIGGNIEIIKSGAGTQYITNGYSNSYTGGTIINQGVLAVNGGGRFNGDGSIATSPLGAGSTTINNAATLDVVATGGGNSLFDTITLGTQGTATYDGDTYHAAGIIASFGITSLIAGDYDVASQFVGGNNLIIGAGDLLAVSTQAGTPGNIYVVGGRLLMFNNTTFIDGATSVTTADGGILDFGTGGSASASMPIYVGANGAINERNTNVTINDLVPVVGTSGNAPSLTIGTDDDDGGGGSITVTNQVALSSNFQINGQETDGQYSNVVFSGGFTGTGNLTFTSLYQTGYPPATQNRGLITVSGSSNYQGDTTVASGILYLTGNNSAVTSAGGGAPNYFVTGSSPAAGVYNPGILQIGAGGSLASDAHVAVGGAAANQYAYFVIGDGNGANSVTVGSITSGAGGDGAIINGNTANGTDSSLAVDVAAHTTDTYTGTIGSDPNGYNFNLTSEGNIANNAANLSLIKNGAGTLALNGANSYTGGTTVNGGRLAINTSVIGGVKVNAGGEVGGSGTIKGAISGAGAVGPGNSPGILTASSVDPTSGMSFNFEMTQTGDPTFTNASASGNDVLHLESGTPFAAPLTLANTINVYFSGNGIFAGGFFLNGDLDTLTINDALANYTYYVLDASGNVVYNGQNYELASALGGTVTMSTEAVRGADFIDGTTDGSEQQFNLSGAAVPEPSTYALMGVAGLVFLFICRRLKA